jgi:hypothetical protein
MSAGPGVGAGMAVGRAVAAADLSALEADSQVQPGVAAGQAVLASVHRLGELGDPDVVEVSAGRDPVSLRDGRRRPFGTGRETRVPAAHEAGVLERGASE